MMKNLDKETRRTQTAYNLIVGTMAGLGFALGSWGIESIALVGASGMFPFAKLLVGLVFCILIGLLAGWLTKLFTSVLANVIIWALVAAGLNRIAMLINFPGMKMVLGWLDPQLKQLVDYTIDYGVKTRGTLMLIIMVVFGLLVGLLVNSFVEEAIISLPFRRWSTFILWAALFFGIALLGDSLNQKPLRDAVSVVDDAIQFQLEHEGEDLPVPVQVQMGLTGLRPIVEYLHSPRRMIAAKYDQMLIFIQVLVQFDQRNVMCSVINNQMGTCRFLE